MSRWYKKVVSRFYGIDGPLDEYRVQEVGKFSNIAYIFMTSYLLLSSVIVLWVAGNKNDPLLLCLVGMNLLVCVGCSLAAGIYVSRKKLDKVYTGDPIKQKKTYRRKAARAGVYFGFWMYIMSGLQNYFMMGRPIASMFSWRFIFIYLVTGFLFGLSMYPVFLARIDK